MNATNFIAAIIGPLYIVIGIGVFLNPNHYSKMIEEFCRSPTLQYLGGGIALAAGLSILYFHNTWSSEWPVIITIFGWLACLKGVHLLIFPLHFTQVWVPMFSRPNFLRTGATTAFALGIFLSLAAYGVF